MDPSTMSNDEANELLNTNACFANHLYAFITSMSLKCAVQLGIADAIHNHGNKPMTISELSTALSIHPLKSSSLHQLMRILTHSGYFSYEKNSIDAINDGVYGYSLTPASQLLLEDHPFSVRPYLLFVLDPILISPWISLGEWFKNKNNVTPFEYSNEMALWECTNYRPKLNSLMMDTMAGDSKMVASILMSNKCTRQVFEGVDTIVDVGGGVGEMAKAISKAFPLMQCMVLDLPHVVESLEGTHNLSYVAGDMFKAIPSANAVLLKWILHDWSDEHSVEILKQCKRAITSNKYNDEVQRKVIIIEIVIDEDGNGEEDYKKKETQLFYDMEMMTVVGGKERSKKEWEKLFSDAGFNGGYKIFPFLGFRSVIELFP